MTLASSYDPDFFGVDLRGAPGMPGDVVSVVDYAYKCGQGATSYRCYGIGKVSHATLVDLQHQVNRLAGKRVIAEDGILGPATLTAVLTLAPLAIANGVMHEIPTTLDDLAAQAPLMALQFGGAADNLRGPETIGAQTQRILAAMANASIATAAEIAADKAAGRVPASFVQGAVRASAAALGRIATRLGPAAAAAAAADQVGTTAGPVTPSHAKLYLGVGIGITALAGITIAVIALRQKPRSRARAR